MKRTIIALTISTIFIFVFSFFVHVVAPDFQESSYNPMRLGSLARDYVVPRYGYETEREIPYDETKAAIVFFTVNIVIYTIPIYLILTVLNRRKVV